MKKRKVLWVDSCHMWIWSPYFDMLEVRGFEITKLAGPLDIKEILSNCKDKDAVVIHCGTMVPTPLLKGMLEDIRKEFPQIKIGLQTNAIHPFVQDLVNFYVIVPQTDFYSLRNSLIKVIGF